MHVEGTWKSKNWDQWLSEHNSLWPGVAVPEVATCFSAGGDSEFVENTLPTSMLFSAVSAQVAGSKRRLAFRASAASVLKDLIDGCNVVAAKHGRCDLILPLRTTTIPVRIVVPQSGQVMKALLLHSLTPEEVEQVQHPWLEQANDFHSVT